MSWRVALSLEKLLEQVNEAAPNRSKVSDGSIGDPAHSSRESDHNPNLAGVVCARDFTHDPANGADMNELAEALRTSRDPRINYVIWNRRIFSSTVSPWTWRPYTGTNPHDHHLHVSVLQAPNRYDSIHPWNIEGRDWFDMASEADLERIVRKVVQEELRETEHHLAIGNRKGGYDRDNVNLAAIKEEVKKLTKTK